MVSKNRIEPQYFLTFFSSFPISPRQSIQSWDAISPIVTRHTIRTRQTYNNPKNLHNWLNGKHTQWQYGSLNHKEDIQYGYFLNLDPELRIHLPGGPGGPATEDLRMLGNLKMIFWTWVGSLKYIVRCTGYADSLGAVANVDQQFDLKRKIKYQNMIKVLWHIQF